ncbi:MAG: hypothetical protein ACKVG7_01845 [Flavobacteriales bacterium]
MKKLMYLLVVGVMFAFTACSDGEKIGCQAGEECVEDQSCCPAAGDDAAGDDAAGDDAAGDDAAGDDAADADVTATDEKAGACCCGNAECAGPETCPSHKGEGDHDH